MSNTANYIAVALRSLRDSRKRFAVSATERSNHDEEYKEVVMWLDKMIVKASKEKP
jgi:hypothetical protein